MGSILVLEAKGAEKDKDKVRRGGVELLSASAATCLQDKKPVVSLTNVYPVHSAGPSGNILDVICLSASLKALPYVLSISFLPLYC